MLLEKMVSNEMLLEQRNYYELKDHVLKSAEICIENANKENKKKTMIYCSYVDKQYLEYFTIGYKNKQPILNILKNKYNHPYRIIFRCNYKSPILAVIIIKWNKTIFSKCNLL